MRSRSWRLRNLLTTSAPKVKETPRSFSPQPWTSLSGSDHSRSHNKPEFEEEKKTIQQQSKTQPAKQLVRDSSKLRHSGTVICINPHSEQPFQHFFLYFRQYIFAFIHLFHNCGAQDKYAVSNIHFIPKLNFNTS